MENLNLEVVSWEKGKEEVVEETDGDSEKVS